MTTNAKGSSLNIQPGDVIDNQAGGLACEHPSTRGVLVPGIVPDIVKDAWPAFSGHEGDMSDNAWDGVLCAIQPSIPWPIIKEGSMEAWLRVSLGMGIVGVIIWENSD